MTPLVSVLVPVAKPADLVGLFGSCDRQSLRQDEFEIVVAVPDRPGEPWESLHAQSRRRPNVRVVAVAPDSGDQGERALRTAAIGAAKAERVLTVRPEDRLLPQSLERLVALDADLVVARSVGLAGAHTDPILFGRAADPDDLRAAAVREPAVLIRRRLLADAPDSRAQLLAGDPEIAILIGYPGLDLRGRGGWQPEPIDGLPEGSTGVADRLRELERPRGPVTLTWDPPTTHWADGRLLLECTGRVAGLAETEPAPVGVLRVREPVHGVELVLPTETQWLSAGDPGSTREVRIRAELDPRSDRDGRPIETAIHQLYGDLVGDGLHAQAPLRGAGPSGAIIEGRPVGVVTIGDRLHLDVGCRRQSLVQQADAGDAIITDSARGTLLRLELPRIAAEPGADLAGEIGLGGLRLPARIVEQDGVARLVAYVSGLSGQVGLSTKFGAANTPLSLVLDISPLGRIQVRPKPAPVPKPPTPAPKAAAPKPAAPSSPAPRASKPTPAGKATNGRQITARSVYRRMRRLLKR
ncbi:hypothetical protein [Microlunatus speluncae]|uniref:hypothetical protein n=1 Tax=Microlunatus speluncae TaxID=2594267 RepID=UPI0012661BA6|nr:hypothetical protein [Microlunatus speluncae]